MLDVHPPHAPAHTWKDFFIHIATIVIGLLIAIGLEQTVEVIHRNHERHQLIEDLRNEAEQRVHIMPANNRDHAAELKFLRDTLHAALAAKSIDGSVTFVIPSAPPDSNDMKPETAVWSAAKASGAVNVLSRPEIEVWETLDFLAQRAERDVQQGHAAFTALEALRVQLGLDPFAPGTAIHVTVAQRDRLTHYCSLQIVAIQALIQDDTYSQGASNAVLHGAETPEQAAPYIRDAFKSMPH